MSNSSEPPIESSEEGLEDLLIYLRTLDKESLTKFIQDKNLI